MVTITLTDKELNVLQDILKRAEGGSEKPARKLKPSKGTTKLFFEKKYGKGR